MKCLGFEKSWRNFKRSRCFLQKWQRKSKEKSFISKGLFFLVVKTNVFLKDMNDFAAMNAVYAECKTKISILFQLINEYFLVFSDRHPARSTVQVAALPRVNSTILRFRLDFCFYFVECQSRNRRCCFPGRNSRSMRISTSFSNDFQF